MSVMSSGEYGRFCGLRRLSFGLYIIGMCLGGVELFLLMGGCGRDSFGGGVGVYLFLEGREVGNGYLVVM